MSRILFCTWQYFPVAAGGAERQARLQAQELVRRGHEVTVVCPAHPSATNGDQGGVRVVRLARSPRRRVGSITYLLNLWRFVLVNAHRFDIAHVHLANLQADVVVHAARLRRLPTHVKVANSGAAGETRRLARIARVTRWYGLRRADSVQALSEETRREVLRIGVSADRVAMIPNGVEALSASSDSPARLRRDLGVGDDDVLVLYLGRFARYKGIGDLINAWRTVAGPGRMLVLVGEEAEDEPLGDLPQAEQTALRPWTSAPQDYMAAADVFVLPSHSEGMSNALLEAMAAGMAIVASDAGAAREMLEDGHSALLYQAGDVAALAGALGRVCDSTELRSQLRIGATEEARRFSVPAVVDALEAVYGRIGR